MAKKKGDSSKTSKAPVCECQHPFNCDCGLRPERPSRGHKWDPELKVWGGKGHKQKGGVGGAVVGTSATVTEKGKTTVAQWMKLPHQLLDEFCKKDKRPPAKFTLLNSQSNKFKFRVIIQDAKASRRGTDYDLIFIPKMAVENEEQAKEEAALLALLSLTPNLPHERKLPEPYKTTWLNAVASPKDLKEEKIPSVMEREGIMDTLRSTAVSSSTSAATASSNLVNVRSYSSLSEKRKQDEENRKEKMERIRKHEAIRMANRDMQVFMSATMRKQIESLLRGDTDEALISELASEDDSPIENDHGDLGRDDYDTVKSYVIERLSHEGFTNKQAIASYTAVIRKAVVSQRNDDEYMDQCYDDCLQWLCVHLDEDNLPEGFDPRGSSLEIISTKKMTSQDSMDDPIAQEKRMNLSNKFGVSLEEASLLLKEKSPPKIELFHAILKYHNIEEALFDPSIVLNESEKELNVQTALEEEEVLRAMFPLEDDFQIKIFDEVKQYMISLSTSFNTKQTLVIEYQIGLYPSVFPKVFIMGGWNTKIKQGSGTTVHLMVYDYLMTLPRGEPMVFEIYNHTQEVLQTINNDPTSRSLSFLQHSSGEKGGFDKSFPNRTQRNFVRSKAEARSIIHFDDEATVQPAKYTRGRARGPFWNIPPNKSPPADPKPKVSLSMERDRKSLPASASKNEFLRVLKEADGLNKVVLVTGETGCGKTTQIPQFILENSPGEAKIVVAQPRRLAATGVADRVACERGEKDTGGRGAVGYVVRGASNVSENTRLLFCTTGILLRQLQSECALDCITHIVIDEVHERNLDTDVLLAILKETRPPHLRIILMSATMDADRFASYWGTETPRIHIPGRTFPVQDFTLEDALEITGYIPPNDGKKKKKYYSANREKKKSPWDDSEFSDEEENDDDTPLDKEEDNHDIIPSSVPVQNETKIPIDSLVKRLSCDKIDYDLIARLVHRLISLKQADDDGSILVFLPGVAEISQAEKAIIHITGGDGMKVLPLHGGLQPQDQNKVFETYHGVTKVILSTNVAETSITIPDCTMVIDTCKEKQSSFDPSNRMPLLIEKLSSLDSLKQRRGRAGRVRPGICYKLISRETLSHLSEHGEPEIKRCSLDQTLLSLLYLGVEKGSGNFLRKLLDPPTQVALDASIDSLKQIGAVVSTPAVGKEKIVSLTPLGLHLAAIPAPPMIGKLLVMGELLGCRSAALAIASALSLGRSPFLKIDLPRNGSNDDESMVEFKFRSILKERSKLLEVVGNSDHAMLAAIFMTWDGLNGGSDKRRYCESIGISSIGMRDIDQLVRQYDSSLSEAGFKRHSDSDVNISSWRIVKSCIVSGLAPSQMVRIQRSSKKYAETVEGALEKDVEAKELKFFRRKEKECSPGLGQKKTDEHKGNMSYYNIPEEQVFVHPSSFNFSTGSYACPWVVFYQLVRTSKPFLRDITECSSYDLLLFGGTIDVVASEGKIIIDSYAHLSANARIGALIGGLRKKVDELLRKKISDPTFELSSTIEMKIISKLLRTDGMGGPL